MSYSMLTKATMVITRGGRRGENTSCIKGHIFYFKANNTQIYFALGFDIAKMYFEEKLRKFDRLLIE